MNSKSVNPENFKDLKKAVYNSSIDKVIKPRKDWGGAYVIITSDDKKAISNNADGPDFYSRGPNDLYIATMNHDMLSGLFYYVKENVLSSPDNYLYVFMALSAIDYIRQYGDGECHLLLSHVVDNAYIYLESFGWKCTMEDSNLAFEVMRSHLSDSLSDEDIKFML